MTQLHIMLANDGHYQFETPANDEKIMSSEDSDKWEVARAEELQACKLNSTCMHGVSCKIYLRVTNLLTWGLFTM